MSRLVSELQPIGRAVARRVLNTPELALHLDARVLGWVLAWRHQTQLSVRSHIARCAGNEARKVRAMSPADRTDYFRRWSNFYRVVNRAGDRVAQMHVNDEDLFMLNEDENPLP